MINISSNTTKKVKNFWNNVLFHPTDAIEDEWGQRILDTISKDNVADTVRIYAMLEDIVSMDENGELQYDFTLNDQRIDYLISKNFDIIISCSFVPPCIAENTSEVTSVCKNKTRYKGKMITASPPKDYKLWEEVCFRYAKHLIERYGENTVSKWYIQCMNEPDIPEFFLPSLGMSNEAVMTRLKCYQKIYECFASGMTRVSTALKIGGPALSHRLDFMDGLLKFVTEKSLRMDFVSIHTYGPTPFELNDGTRMLHAENTLNQHLGYMEVINKYFPDGIEVIVDEWGADFM